MYDKDINKIIEQLENENIELKQELRSLKRKPVGTIGNLLLFIGLFLLFLAFVFNHNISAFVGIALTFWGALFFYIKPTRFIRKSVLDSTLIEPLKNTYLLLDELKYYGIPVYVSVLNEEGLQSPRIYLPKSDDHLDSPFDEVVREQTFYTNPQTLQILPPGLGLSDLIEDELQFNYSTLNIENLENKLKEAFIEVLEIAHDFKMEVSKSNIIVEIGGTVFFDALEELYQIGTRYNIGDPLSSAIACMLTKSMQSPIIIERIESNKAKKLIKITYKMKEQIKNAST